MSMETTSSLILPASPADVFPVVADLGTTPRWLPLVHSVDVAGDQAWWVELRASVGPFARSKRLRMVRVDHRPDASVRFERVETDGRSHAAWILRCELEQLDPDRGEPAHRGSSTLVTMHLEYHGRLWTPGPLSRVLDDEIRRGRDGLLALFSAAATTND